MIYTIYAIRNDFDDRVYIGFTSMTVQQRWDFHVKDAPRSKGSHLHHAIVKHGSHHFSIEPIYQSQEKDHTLNVMEAFFIKEYDSINKGFNIQEGGAGGAGKPIKVYQYSKTLELIKVWDSVKDAAASIGVASAQISAVMTNAENGKASSLKGSVWVREGVQPKLKKGSVIVEKLNDSLEVIERFQGYLSASRSVSGSGNGISEAIKHPHQRWYGYYWRAISQ